MFGPAISILQSQGRQLTEDIQAVIHNLIRIAEGTEAQLTRNQWIQKSVGVAEGQTSELRNDSAMGWMIRGVVAADIALKKEPEGISVFINSNGAAGYAGLVDGDHQNVRWYVPPGGVIYVTHSTGEPGTEEFSTNFWIEVLEWPVREASGAKSGEHITPMRVSPVPSGHPVDDYEPSAENGVRTK